jgi:hypothetical protein
VEHPAQAHALLDEADIGSGEKTPGERETDEIVSQVGKREEDQADKPGKDGK